MARRSVVYAADMLEKGDPAPDFNLPDQHGNPVSMPKAPANDDIDAMVAGILASGFTLNSRKD